MDLAEFNLIRPPRRGGARELRLEATLTVHPAPGKDVVANEPEALSISKVPNKLGPASTDPLGPIEPEEPSSILARLYALVGALDERLLESDDRIEGDDLEKLVTALLKRFHLDGVNWANLTGGTVQTAFGIVQLGIRGALIRALTKKQPDFERAAELTRRALIAGLLAESVGSLDTLTAEDVFDLLNRRALVLDGVTAEQLAPRSQVKLIREAQVADLQVVRREWTGYLASEIANIRNVMAGESFEQHDKTTTEVETTTQQSTDVQQLQETEDQSKVNREFSSELNSQLAISINGHAEASAEFKYPVVTARVSGGIDASVSLQRSEQHASKVAREAVSRTVSRTDTTTRESRSRRELFRTEQGYDYELQNTGGEHAHGVYRWVDRVDTYQLFRYPSRFLLEFQIPEPAEFYRWRTQRLQASAAAVDKPVPWTLHAKEITAARLVELAKTYHATNVPPAPDEKISIARTISVELGPESVPKDRTDVWNPTPASKAIDIELPTDYAATQVKYDGQGYPIFGWWSVPDGQSHDHDLHYVGYRAAFATVSIGDTNALYWNGGVTPAGSLLATHGQLANPVDVKDLQEGSPAYGRSLLSIGKGSNVDATADQVTLTPPAVNVLKVELSTVGVLACTLSVLVECRLKEEAKAAWQLSVYDALYAGWTQWKRDYDAAQNRQALVASAAADAGSSQRNEQIIREELKREVISWLLDEEGFAGRPGLKAPAATTTFADINFDQARRDAPTIQFLEQAFEWSNLAYMFYPYYWAKRSDWEAHSQIVANDPDFERFLRAGSARVILPTRPGFDEAVRNWLVHRTPFITGRLPTPDDPLYVSIDTEIRELTSPWRGGYPGDHWQSRVSTTLLYLEKEGDLPFTNTARQLPAPVGVWYEPKDYVP